MNERWGGGRGIASITPWLPLKRRPSRETSRHWTNKWWGITRREGTVWKLVCLGRTTCPPDWPPVTSILSADCSGSAKIFQGFACAASEKTSGPSAGPPHAVYAPAKRNMGALPLAADECWTPHCPSHPPSSLLSLLACILSRLSLRCDWRHP